jgi:hypothetical protein
MATPVRSIGWSAWVIIFVVLLLTLLAGVLFFGD